MCVCVCRCICSCHNTKTFSGNMNGTTATMSWLVTLHTFFSFFFFVCKFQQNNFFFTPTQAFMSFSHSWCHLNDNKEKPHKYLFLKPCFISF